MFTAGLRKESPAFRLLLKFFLIVFFYPAPWSSNSRCEKYNCFWHLHPFLPHIPCNLREPHSLFESHYAALLKGNGRLCLHFADFWKDAPLVFLFIYLVKVCDLFRLYILPLPLITLTTFCVLGFKFSYTIWFIVSL